MDIRSSHRYRAVDVLVYSESDWSLQRARRELLGLYDELMHSDTPMTSDEVNHEYIDIAVRQFRKFDVITTQTVETVADYLYEVWLSHRPGCPIVEQCCRLMAVIAAHYVRKYDN